MIAVAALAVTGVMWAGGVGPFSTTDSGGQGSPTGQSPGVGEVKTASIELLAHKLGGSTVTSVSDVNASVWMATQDDPYATRKKGSGSFSIENTISSGFANNDMFTVVEMDSGYYTAPTGRAAGVEKEQPLQQISIGGTTDFTAIYNVHEVAAESDLAIQVRDEFNDELTSGTSNQEDYELSLGQAECKTVTVRLKQNGNDKFYDVQGFALKELNDVDSVDIESVYQGDTTYSFSSVERPEHLKDSDIAMNETESLSENVTGYDTVYEFDQTVSLEENDKLFADAEVCAPEDTDPAAVDSGDLTTTDAFVFEWKDADWYGTSDLRAGYGMADDSTSEADVGLDETDYSPLGKEAGVIVEIT